MPRERDPALIVPEVGWAPGPVWTGTEYLVPTGILSPDRTARFCISTFHISRVKIYEIVDLVKKVVERIPRQTVSLLNLPFGTMIGKTRKFSYRVQR
jgi:hypothetical protein